MLARPLLCFKPAAAEVVPSHDADLYRANALLRWLLRTHVCITGLKLQSKWVTAHSQIILEELPENSRLRKLRVEFPFGDNVQNHFATLLPRLRHLEELHCFMSPSTDALVAAISTLLRNTTCLTTLIFQVLFENGQPPQTFVDALAANSTLKSLEMWANWSTTEPPGSLGEYVMGNRLITTLNLFGEETDREELSLDEALVRNSTLSTLKIGRLCGGETTARFLARILAECASIKKLILGGLRDEYVNIPEATLRGCAEALAHNETLEELTLSYSLWHPSNWITFFAFLPKNKHLKKLEVSNHWPRDYGTFAPVLQALANTNSSHRVSFGSYMHSPVARDFMCFGAFSRIKIYGELSLKVSALQRLLTLDQFTSLSLGLYEADQTLFSSLAEYVRATATLQELSLCVTSPGDSAYSSCWTPLLESLLANTSITFLLISSSGNLVFNDRLAAAIGLSRYITCVYYVTCTPEWNPTSFVLPLSEAIRDNYTLLSVHLSSGKVDAEARRSLFTIRDTTRRNSDLVNLAFDPATPLDWYTAYALEKVSQRPALVRKLAEKERMTTNEMARMIRSRLRSVEGLHDFMRLTGVVQECVKCAPPADGCSMQLEDLNGDCWSLLRRYLSFDDVKGSTIAEAAHSTSC